MAFYQYMKCNKEIYSDLSNIATNKELVFINEGLRIEDVHISIPEHKTTKEILMCLSLPTIALLHFAFENCIGIVQYLAISIEMSSDWMYYIFDLFKGLEVFTINVQATAYLVIVIILIVVICTLSILMLLTMFDICNLDWMEACDEVLFIIVYEILFFGFLALPIIKFLFQTYDCRKNSNGERVLRRDESIKCESAGQIILFIFAIITIILLLIGTTIRNLAREEYMHFKKYKWRVKPNVKHLLIKEMYLKIAIMIFAVFGPDHEWWPSLINMILCSVGGIYYFVACPYVRKQLNNMKVSYYFMMIYIFFVSMIANIGESIEAFKNNLSY